jgi:tetratricopeptide (TPR) repeat protein
MALAHAAFDRGNRKLALEIRNKMRVQFPTLYVTSETGLSLTLDLGYYDEAERLLRDGRRRFPGQALFFAVGSVRVAQHRGDLKETVRRCEILRRKFPHAEEGYAVAATCLSDLGRHDEADVVIGRGVSKCSDNYDLCALHAERATQRRDWLGHSGGGTWFGADLGNLEGCWALPNA